MGASREAAFSAFAEPALFLCLVIVCVPARTTSLSDAFRQLPWASWGSGHPVYLIAAATLFLVLLCESSRIPFDDPNTHLELTMVHEVMVLDHGGPDFAFVAYGAAVKLFVVGALLVNLALPTGTGAGGALVLVAGELLVAVLVGVVESVTARIRLIHAPQYLIGASVLGSIGVAILLYRGAP
jgi:formate hydrogenlyase subunit 4